MEVDEAVTEKKTEKPDYDELRRLNSSIALHAKRKELSEAMSVFNDVVSKGWANTHTYAGAINCSVRCGDLDKARGLFDTMRTKKGLKADVVHYTTMMKGYCEVGDMSNAAQLLEDMKIRRVEANVRTMNTFLRGCVQTGDIEKAEILLAVMTKDFKVQPDVSSWEYLITLLSQGLRTDKVLPILGRLKGDADMVGGLSSMYINLARSSAILGDWKVSRRAIGQAKEAIKAEEESQQQSEADASAEEGAQTATPSSSGKALGGKRAWKGGDGVVDDARAQSLALFREHKVAEQRQDLDLVERYVERRHQEQLANRSSTAEGKGEGDMEDVTLSFFQRVLSFAQGEEGGGAEGTAAGSLAEAALRRFGLDAYIAKCCPGGAAPPVPSPSKANHAPLTDKKSKAGKKGFKKKKKEEKVAEASSVPIAVSWSKRLTDHYARCLDSDGNIDFDYLFGESSTGAPLKLEICSGAGEWAVAQAEHDTSSRYITLELRHDRVYSTFYRSVCAETKNLCVIGGDAVSVLDTRIAWGSLQNIFINHPEPPQQSNQGSQSQGRHLLTTDFLNAAASKLRVDGMLTIVTDNAWYARFLMRQLAGAPHPRALINVDVTTSSGSTLKETENEGGYSVYVGKPDASCGYTKDASSYFDRLWKRGNLVDRYVLVLRKKSAEDVSGLRIRQYKKGSAPVDIGTDAPKAKKIKFDD